MRPPYIFHFVLFFATILGASGCSLLESIKRPNGLASRVGNFSPVKLDSDKAEIKAAKNVTPLPRGSRDLDGRQENFDPAFGAPETDAELSAERAGMNSTRGAAEPEILGSRGAGSQPGYVGESTGGAPQLAGPAGTEGGASPLAGQVGTDGGASQFAGQAGTTGGASRIASSGSAGVSPSTAADQLSVSPDSSRFGMARGSIKPTNFGLTRSTTPISETPSSSPKSNQGFGCPPAGTTGLGNSSSFGQSQGSFGTQMASVPQTQQNLTPPVSTATSSPPTDRTLPTSAPNRTFGLSRPLASVPNGLPGAALNLTPVTPIQTSNAASTETLTAAANQTPIASATVAPSSSDSGVPASTTFSTSVPSGFGSPNGVDSQLSESAASPSSQGRANSFGQMPRMLKSLDELPRAVLRKPKSQGWSFLGFLWGNPPSGDANDFALVDAQNNHAKNVDVTVIARVKRLLPDDTQGSPHQRFILQMSTGSSVLVAHNISLASHVPLKEGEYVTVCGEYIWNEKGGVLHYTHHATNTKHCGGYIEYNHQKYQ